MADQAELTHPYHVARLSAVEAWAQEASSSPWAVWRALEVALDDPHRGVREAAALAVASASLHEEGVLSAVASLSVEGSARRRLACLFALEQAGRQATTLEGAGWEAAREAALAAAGAGEGALRYQGLTAAHALGAQGPGAVAAARAALAGRDGGAAAAAVELLAALGEVALLGEVEAAVGRLRGDEAARATAAWAELARQRPSGAAVPAALLARLQEGSGRLPHGLRLCEALGALGGAEAAACLRGRATGWLTHRLIQAAAAGALVRMGAPEGPGLLRRLMQHRREDARGLAIEQAGRWGGEGFVEELASILRAPQDYHADPAALARGWIDAPSARAALEAAREDPRAEVRAEVRRALGGSPGAADNMSEEEGA